jgi:hypothetical protein
MKALPDDDSMQSYFTTRRILSTFLGVVFYFMCPGGMAIINYRRECVHRPPESGILCNNRIFTITLASLLFGFAGFLYGGHLDRERRKSPETRRQEAERADQARRDFVAVRNDTSRLGFRCAWAIVAVAAHHAFGQGTSLLQELIEDCPDGLWPASLECYLTQVQIVMAYFFVGYVGFHAAVFWELYQGILPKRRE